MLIQSKLPATEIGLTVGYASFSTFSSRFSQLVGVSPQQFRDFIQFRVKSLSQLQSSARQETDKSVAGVSGQVKVSENFEGIICIGLFSKPIPLGKPIGCTILFESGEYCIPNIPDGTYYAMSIAFSWEDDIEEYLDPQQAIRGKAIGKVRVINGVTKGKTDIVLRPPNFYDPPMLVSFPLCIHGKNTA
jgi:AraC family transcriptional regulator